MASALYAEDAKIPCRYKDGKLGLNSLESFDCKLASKVSSDKRIKEEYKEHVDKKIAQIVANKTAGVIEDLALLDSYLDQNNIDLGHNVNVMSKCSLKSIAKPNCKSNISQDQINKRLALILSGDRYLPAKEGDNKFNKDFYSRMLLKASAVRSGDKIKEKKCPVDGDAGDFVLNSQFTFVDAKFLVETLQQKKKNSTIDAMFKNFPQLKMLTNGNDVYLRKKFEEAIEKFDGKVSHKEFVDNFFKDKDVQLKMGDNVAEKCTGLKESINAFVCEDNYSQLAMNEEDRDVLFDGRDNDDKIFKEVSRGLSCTEEEKEENADSTTLFAEKDSVHQKMTYLKKDIRTEKPNDQVVEVIGDFCSLYMCQTPNSSTNYPSCKNGGPISSEDILLMCPKKDVSTCDGKVQKNYEYISSLERDARNAGLLPQIIGVGSNSSNLPLGNERPRGFSSFYQNFLGVEGTLVAEGKKITPITIAEKKAEFVEKKIDVGPNSISLSQTREGMKAESVRQEPITPIVENSSSDTVIADVRESDQFRRSFQSQQFSKANYDISKDANGKSKKVKFTDTDSSTLDEMKKLRSELSDALGKVRGTDDEKLAAIADNNAVAITPKGSSVSPIRNLNSGEKDRLDSYRENLNNWENRLRSWQNNLSDRDVKTNSGSGSASDARPVAAPAASDDQFNTANGSANGARLSKSTAAAGIAGAKGELTGDRAPGAEKVELEPGVVSSEKLATLGKESLKDLGITDTDSFIIKIRHKEKIYSVPVKTFTHSGKSMYVPLLNDKDRELSKIVYESPLFKDYRTYQIERQYKLEKK